MRLYAAYSFPRFQEAPMTRIVTHPIYLPLVLILAALGDSIVEALARLVGV